jgi:hypothetical protein
MTFSMNNDSFITDNEFNDSYDEESNDYTENTFLDTEEPSTNTNAYWYQNMHKINIKTCDCSHCWCYRETLKEN